MLWLAYTGDGTVALGVLTALMTFFANSSGRAWLWCLTSACCWILACALLASAHMCDMRILLGVFEHSHAGLDWWYKIASLWTYFDGSFLLWTSFLAIMCWVRWVTNASRSHKEAAGWAGLLLGHGLILLLSAQPFAVLASLPPEGLGFVPTLRAPHVVFHPPMMYMGMALLALPAMTTLAQPYNVLNMAACQRYGRWAYCVMTTGLVWGGVWAYTELGWGGMWFWDPVETMALIPWVAQLMVWHQWPRHSALAWRLSPLPLVMVLFQVWGVRSGWLVSIHSFARDDEKGWLMLIGAVLFAFVAARHFRTSTHQDSTPVSITGLLFGCIILVLAMGVTWSAMGGGVLDASWFNGMLVPFMMAGAWLSTLPQDRIWVAGLMMVGLAGFSCTPDPSWIHLAYWGIGLWMLLSSLKLPLNQKMGHLSFGLLFMSLAWKATWSYELVVTADQPTHGIHLNYQGTVHETTPLSTHQIDRITLNGQNTTVVTEHYKDGTTTHRMGTILGLWSHWQVSPVSSTATTTPTYWVGYRHGIHGVWAALIFVILALSWPIRLCTPPRSI